MQMYRSGDLLRRRTISALVPAVLVISAAGPLSALDPPAVDRSTVRSLSSLAGVRVDRVVAPASLYASLAARHVGVVAFSGHASNSAFPGFGRQTGLACSKCHFQKYPALTAFGRAFQAGGYTMMAQEPLTGDRLSLPPVLNSSVFLKVRYQKTNGTEIPGQRTTNIGELQFPDEFAVLMGGRVSENAGFVIEGQLAEPTAPFVSGFKMPFTFKVGSSVRANVVPFATEHLGAAYGFELMNTGAVRHLRVNENRNAVSAQQYIGTATAAEGVAFVLVDPNWFVNVSKWSPNHFAGAQGVANGSPTATYMRAAFTPTVGPWDLGIGIQRWSGLAETANAAGTGVNRVKTDALAFDAQAQGEVSGLPLGVYVTQGKSDAGTIFNSRTRSRSALTVTAEVGVMKRPFLTVLGGFRSADNGRAAANSTDNAITFGVNWMASQNVGLHWILNKFSGSAYAAGQGPMNPGGTGTMLNTLMLSAGF